MLARHAFCAFVHDRQHYKAYHANGPNIIVNCERVSERAHKQYWPPGQIKPERAVAKKQQKTTETERTKKIVSESAAVAAEVLQHSSNLTSHLLLQFVYIYSFVFTSSYARSLISSGPATSTTPPFPIPNNNKINIFLALFYVLILCVVILIFALCAFAAAQISISIWRIG